MPILHKELFDDGELWALYRPTGKEIQARKETFGHLGIGSKDLCREARRLLRQFARG